MPAAFRRVLATRGGDRLVATVLDQCLAVYPAHEWSRLESSLAALPPFSKPVKALSRLLSSRAVDCRLDVQGRILIPSTLRAAAKLERAAVVAGVLNRFEIWEPAAWSAFLADSDKPYALGGLMTVVGLVLGVIVACSRIFWGNEITTATVVLVALLLVSGTQFTLFAMWFDQEANKELR